MSTFRFYLLFLCWVMINPLNRTTAAGEPCHSAPNGLRRIPKQVVQRPIPLRRGIGRIHERVTTTSQLAQVYYDQGLTLLYSYEWIDAARSFSEALRRDSKLAMAYLGLSYAFSGLGDDASAIAAEDQAQGLAQYANRSEVVRIGLRLRQLQSMAAERQRLRDGGYVAELTRALAADPSNTQLILLRGNASEGSSFGMGQQGDEASIGYYKQVLRSDPDNPIAHHFLIHSYEMLNEIDQATEHARAFVDRAPFLSHAHHMYGHELFRAGKIREAVVQFEQADALADKMLSANPGARIYDWHYRHNLNLLAASYRQVGSGSQAEATLRKLAMLPNLREIDEYYQAQLAAFLLQQSRYTEALLAVRDYQKPTTTVGLVLKHVIKAIALANSGSSDAAAVELSTTEQHLRLLDPAWRSLLQPWVDILRAQLDIGQSRPEAAARRLINEARGFKSLAGTDAWSDGLFHLEYIGDIATRARLWDAVYFSAERLRVLAPAYGGGERLLIKIRESQLPQSAK